MTVTLLVLAALAAVADWFAVGRRLFRLEYLLKPLTMLLLAAAASGGLGEATALVLAALALGTAGDVAIMLAAPRGADRAFYTGLVCFLLGHVAWVVAFVVTGLHPLPFVSGLLVAIGVGGLALPAVLDTVTSRLRVAVAGYSLAVGAMAAFAAATQLLLTALGGALFVVSDALLARERFLDTSRRVPWPPNLAYSRTRVEVAVAVTYHLAQFGLLGGLLAAA